MEQQGNKLKYRCQNYGSCSKAASGEIVLGPPHEAPKCQECTLPLVCIEKPTLVEGVMLWVKAHRPLVGVLAAVAMLAAVGVGVWRIPGFPWLPGLGGGQSSKSTKDPAGNDAASKEKRRVEEEKGRDEAAKRRTEQEQRRAEEAKRRAEDAAKQANARALVNTAVIYMTKGQLKEADEQLGKALEQNPKENTAYLNRAIILARQNHPIEALQNVEKAFMFGFEDLKTLESDPDFAIIRSRSEYRDLLVKHPNVLEKHPDLRLKYKISL